MQLNAETKGHRKYILVQAPEVCGKKRRQQNADIRIYVKSDGKG